MLFYKSTGLFAKLKQDIKALLSEKLVFENRVETKLLSLFEIFGRSGTEHMDQNECFAMASPLRQVSSFFRALLEEIKPVAAEKK